MSKYRINPISTKDLKTYPLSSRKSKVSKKDFAETFDSGNNFKQFIDSLPDILAGKDFKEFIKLIKEAKNKDKAILFAFGAHIIKVGLSPIIIDMLKKGWISGIALNGAGIIHDFEIAHSGQTSEDVEQQIENGQFGMANETGAFLNEAAIQGFKENIGLGEAVGKMMDKYSFPNNDVSILYNSYKMNVPVTVHVALGTDIIHFHPKARGDALGKTSLRDFLLFCSMIKKLEGGGIFINVGSSVILPEVFLKALAVVRNKGYVLKNFTTAVIDFNLHYRPYQNIIKRPLYKNKNKGFYFLGHHEILIPLLAASLKAD
ncbi:MAG: hypothetical protein ACOC5T_07915 [Elusimicrobiota bacterium]